MTVLYYVNGAQKKYIHAPMAFTTSALLYKMHVVRVRLCSAIGTLYLSNYNIATYNVHIYIYAYSTW